MKINIWQNPLTGHNLIFNQTKNVFVDEKTGKEYTIYTRIIYTIYVIII